MSAYHNGQLPPGPWRGPGRMPDEGPSFLQAGGGLGGSPPVGAGSAAALSLLCQLGLHQVSEKHRNLQNHSRACKVTKSVCQVRTLFLRRRHSQVPRGAGRGRVGGGFVCKGRGVLVGRAKSRRVAAGGGRAALSNATLTCVFKIGQDGKTHTTCM